MPPPMSRVGPCSHPVRGCRTKLGVDARDGGNFQRPSRLPRTRDHGVRSRAPARGRLCDFHTAEGVPTASSRSGSRRRALPKRLRRTTPEHVGRLPMSIPSTGAGWALGRRGKVSRRTRCTRSSGEDPMLNSASRGGAMIVALAAAAVLVACGSDSSSTSSGSASNSSTSQASALDKQVAAQVPAAVKSKGTLTVAADATYPPNEFIGADGKTVEGMDADLAKALAGVMGLKANVGTRRSTASSRASRPASTTSACRRSPTPRSARRRSTSSPTSRPARRSTSRRRAARTINTLADLCGHKVAAEKGTTQADGRRRRRARSARRPASPA